ncbi:hypothetical protein BT93_D0069 [Corymbia citriodora subsp. variegata]|nr:hypothetical protein BT93_D0069 [Corymbia citriodora subsp. variegata]
MGFEPWEWYCQPVANGIWARSANSAFGAYTPCAMDSLVISISYLVLLGLCCYRIWLIKTTSKVQRYSLKSKCYHYMVGLLPFYCTAEPVLRLLMGFSVFNLDGQTSLLPYEMVSLTIESLAWCSMLVMIGLEMQVYIREFRWYLLLGLIYVLVGEAVMLNLVLLMRDHYQHHRSALHMYISKVFCQVLFGILLLVYVPNLVPYPGYTMIHTKPLDSVEYEALPGEEQVCPERHVNIFSMLLVFLKTMPVQLVFMLTYRTAACHSLISTGIYFGWMTPLMRQGYRRPITEKDVWKLDSWDQTETLFERFQKCWVKESQRPKPLLLRALNSSLGGRFWLGGFFKVSSLPFVI